MAIKEEIRALYSMIGIDEHPTRTHAYTGSTYNKWTDSATMSQRSKGDDTKVHKNGYNNVHIKTSMSTGNLHVQSTDHCVLIPPRNDTDYSERDSSSTLLMCTDYTDDRSANLMNSAQLYPGFSSDNILDNGLIGRAKHFNCKTNNQNSHTPQCAVNNKLHVDTEIFNCDTPDTEPLDKVGCGNLHVNNGVYSNNINTSPSEVSAIARYSLSNYKNMGEFSIRTSRSYSSPVRGSSSLFILIDNLSR